MVDSATHFGDVDGVGDVVELVAVGAGEVAAAHGDDVRHVRVARGRDCRGDRAKLAQLAGSGDEAAADRHAPNGWSCSGSGFRGWNFRRHVRDYSIVLG